MATAYQKIRQRKLIYLGLIVVLFLAAYLHRTQVIERAAKDYSLSESNLGKVDLGGSVSRFVLSSFRGPLVCGLWWEALEQQKNHNYSQLELLIKALTLLQPHYKGPWKYQAWNLAYNVSVEFDRAQDKYFYISKGLRWLANGEEKNRIRLYDEKQQRERVIGDPEMRQEFAQHLSTKMYYADEQLIFRPFLHMSCIPPTQRDAQRLRNNPQQLADFKKQFPRFVRRVQTYRNVADGDEAGLNRELTTFLEEHQEVPSLWKIDPATKALEVNDDPWPRWPDAFKDSIGKSTLNDALGRVADQEQYQDGLEIAVYWYEFANEPMPPPKTDLTQDITPTDEDRFTRRNKHMHSMIFRASPARAKCRSGEELGKEGWATEAQKVWQEGFQMWLELGRKCNMEQPTAILKEMGDKSKSYGDHFPHLAEMMQPPPEYLNSAATQQQYQQALEGYKGLMFMSNYFKLRHFCHYDHWRSTAEISSTDLFREATQAKYMAEKHYTDWPVAHAQYERAVSLLTLLFRLPMSQEEQLALRLSLLGGGPGPLLAQITPPVSNQLSDWGKDDQSAAELLELQDSYLRVLAREQAPQRLRAESAVWSLRQALSGAASAAGCPGSSPLLADLIAPPQVLNIDLIEDILETAHGPFDDFISPQAKGEYMARDKQKKK
jgi:hypothetical protein